MKRLLLIILIAVNVNSAQGQARTAAASDPIIRFYPNPATSFITFDFQKAFEAGYSIQIYNFPQGKKVYEAKNMSQRTTINLSDYNRGVYIYQLHDVSGRMVASGKFQVSR
ncbi:MAG TPA: T9SS type A sorting domain-containing protein [Flavisolibacter sp.]|nr:T9SS type A sorting domain-containing protein [Flavisolibacter sp.]